jgi:hypothetical protein
MQLNIVALSTPNITSFSPFVDASWLESQQDINVDIIDEKFSTTLIMKYSLPMKKTEAEISLYELANCLVEKIPNIQYGEGSYTELNNSYLETSTGDFKIKIKGYKLEYTYNKPITTKSIIDYSKEILGIVEKYEYRN